MTINAPSSGLARRLAAPIIGTFYVLLAGGLPLIAWAQTNKTGTPKAAAPAGTGGVSSGNIKVPQPMTGDSGQAIDLPTVIGQVIKTAIGAAGAIALLMFIYAGFKMMTAQGNAEKMNEGKKTMIWAVFGLIGVFLSYAAVRVVLRALGAA